MRKELREKIIAFNKAAAAQKDKATDMDILISAFAKLPYGQLKQILTDEVEAVLEKYGVV